MRKQILKYTWQAYLALAVLILCAGCGLSNQSKPTAKANTVSRQSFDKGWQFKLYDYGTDDSKMGNEKASLDDSDWRTLNLPHDWAVEGGFDINLPNNTGKLPFPGVGWYRKHFTIDAADSGKRIFIDFDGAMSHTKVWLNDQYIGQWPYGYASFRLELTPHIKFGEENVLAVRLNNPENSSRWYPGGGIYRHTWLVKTNPVHVAHWGTFVTTPEISDKAATVKIQTEIQNQTSQYETVMVNHEIVSADRPAEIIATAKTAAVSIAAGKTQKAVATVKIQNPKRWDIENPNLYTVRTTLTKAGKTLDVYETPFGIRTILFDADNGFLLNGKRVQLNGVCMHHDLGPLGAAVHRRAVERQVEILKEMGCNAIRTSHNPPTPELLEVCDQLGMLLIVEAFDCWKWHKMKNDYSTVFEQWYEKDIVSLVRRDRNHPSVIMWSTGNEIPEQGSAEGIQRSAHLTKIFHREDPTRPVTAGCSYPNAAWNGFGDTLDVYGFNYKPHMYKEYKKRRPDMPFYSSESSSCVSSRGEYFFPVSEEMNGGFFNFQVSSYDLYAPGWAQPPDKEFEGQDGTAAVAGEFVWTGFDYIGEPTPYNHDASSLLNFHTEAEKAAYQKQLDEMGGKTPSRSSYFGIIDLCGFKKDRFYLYQARWRPEMPMAHILPHWNWPDRVGKVTPVHVYTSGDEAELFLNGKSLGRKRKLTATEDKPEPSMSLATGKNAAAGTEEKGRGNVASKANDDDLSTRWCASDGSENQWWQVDLGSVQPIKSCVIYWETNSGNYAYRLKVSKDNQNWTTVAEVDYEGSSPHSLLTFDATGQYVRIEFTGLKKGRWASFNELHVFNHANPKILETQNKLFDRYRIRWNDVVYQPGELKVVAYKDGKKWAEDVMATTDEATTLTIEADRKVIDADGRDLSFVTLKVVDNNGLMVPRSNPKINFTIDGPGEIVATGNGDATDLTSFLSKERNAYNGMCLAIVRSLEGQTGTIRIKAESDSLTSAQTTITTQ